LPDPDEERKSMIRTALIAIALTTYSGAVLAQPGTMVVGRSTSLTFTQQLIVGVLTVVLTAALSTFLIPYIFRRIDQHREDKQKELEHERNLEQTRVEADLARQSKIIDAQAAFLDDISQQLWRFRYLAMAVSYYFADVYPERYQEAVKSYDQESWNIFQDVRASISKSRRLVSENAYQKLVEFYENKMAPFDQKKVRQVVQSNEGHHELNQYIYHEFTSDIDNIIYFLSEQLQLTSKLKSNS
jgi:hypothetical protein